MNSLAKSSLLFGLLSIGNQAFAAAQISFGEDKYISLGVGAIASYQSIENGAGDGDSRSNDFKLNSARIIINGSLNKYIKGMIRTERLSGTGETEIIDANVQFEFTPELAIWAGRFLSPSDRANMSGPYSSMGGGFWANVAARYAAFGGYVGRDDGVAIVGRAMNQRLHYSFGAFEGDTLFRFTNVGAQSEALGTKDKLMYAGRVQYDFWDVETGYYGTGNYFGTKDILSIGISGRMKKDGVISNNLAVGDYKAFSVDMLMEKRNVGPGTVSFEAAYYHYDTDDLFLGEQGKAYLIGTGYLFNQKVGWGQFMPFVRYQKFDADGITNSASVNTQRGAETTKTEIGLNYVIEPYNAMITAALSDTRAPAKESVNALNVSVQFQF